jgi:hypothetical protein
MVKKLVDLPYFTTGLVVCVLIFIYVIYVLLKVWIRRPSVDIVVARYMEDLSWLQNILPEEYGNMYIYNKGDPLNINIPNCHVIQLPNLGRECHTYFHHVATNYDRLPNMTIFIPGSTWARFDKRVRFLRVLNHIKLGGESAIPGYSSVDYINSQRDFEVDKYEITNPENRKSNSDTALHRSAERPLHTWFEKNFPGEKLTCMSFTGIMAATAVGIRKRPIEFYKRLLEEVSYTNPESCHYYERTWKNIFSIDRCLEE